jgi:hypothetical protein
VHHYGAWAAASQYMFAHWIDVGQASVVRRHFPSAGFSEYGLSINGGPMSAASPTSNGFLINVTAFPATSITPGPNRAGIPGTMQSPALYQDESAGLAKILKQKFRVRAYPVTPFNAARQAVNTVRSAILGAAGANSSIEMVPYLACEGPRCTVATYLTEINQCTPHHTPVLVWCCCVAAHADKTFKEQVTNASDAYQVTNCVACSHVHAHQ